MRRRLRRAKQVDFTLLITVIMLVLIGLIMVYSSSWPEAMAKRGDGNFFLKRQISFTILGTFLMVVMMNINYKLWEELYIPIYVVSLLSVLLVFTHEGFKGAQRWVSIAGITFMPGDIVKIGSILFFAKFLKNKGNDIGRFKEGTIPALIVIGLSVMSIIIQKDLGTSIILFSTMLAMLFVAGLKVYHLVPFMGVGVVGLNVLYIKAVNSPGSGLHIRLNRILSFMDPFADRIGGGWQAVNSLHALGSGGLFGLGLGKSRQKFFYIPEPYNDFIFAIIGEELGFIGALFVIILFMILVWRGVHIAMNVKDKYASYVATGITALVAIQAIIHISVVTSSMPTTGITLPFISYGGTSLVIFMVAMGILLNISRFTETV